MAKVLIGDIIDSFFFGEGLFRTLSGWEPSRKRGSRICFVAGREGVVVPVRIGGTRSYNEPETAMKCYSSPQPFGETIHNLLASFPDEVWVKPRFLPQELYVGKCYIDVALYPWIEGGQLDWECRRAIHNGRRGSLLAYLRGFLSLALSILEAEWRHGDLKPENILCLPDGSQRLIDCDSLYHPSLPHRGHAGTPIYNHPSRGDAYDSHIDDYAIALIATSLAAHIMCANLPEERVLVAHPSEGYGELLAELFAESEDLTALLLALNGNDYRIPELHNHIAHLNVYFADYTLP